MTMFKYFCTYLCKKIIADFFQLDIFIVHWSVTANFCLQTFPAAIWVFAINYPKILKLPQILRHSCIFARAAPRHFPLHLLLICPTTSHFCDFWPRQNSDKNWTQIGHRRYSVADTRSSYQKFRNSFKLRTSDAKSADLPDFILLQNPLLFVPRHPSVDCAPALQSLFICFPNQNLICLQFNHKILQTWFLQSRAPRKIFGQHFLHH